ncbi:uncharacterized protein LOC134189603 [Corticium candelabrum]|uniref:uncharacterized protein LOC134189603 n=1 Tax=Corticium candelabrum TaxID=121492 RepID=UPI002E274DCC|nr:uncharacterized protein LOC134189603 [Corticium candelabrum]XP_062513920.1 uncharacterized protein LOC134189603 [Corticium candelabrum]
MRKGKNIEAEKVLFEAVNIEAVWLHENHPNKIYSQNLYEKLKWSLWRDVVEVQYPTEYLQGKVVEFYLTLKAVHKLSTAADLPNSHLPSHSPSLPDEEQEASYFCSEEGLHSCGFTSSSTSQRDSTSSQRSILQQPANVHTVSQCAVGPSYSKVQEKSSLLVRPLVGSEVPYTGCTFRYIDTTGQTVEEVPGERLDSRTIETVTPAWPHADRVEIHIFSSDGQTRLGYFVHVFIDLSAKVLPDYEGDSSMLPGVVDQGIEKEHPSVRPVCVAKTRRLSS